MRIYFGHLSDPTSTENSVKITLSDGHELEIWRDRHYQLWQNGEMLVEGYDVADTLFAYGSTVAPDKTRAAH